jgi:hypothetical protein
MLARISGQTHWLFPPDRLTASGKLCPELASKMNGPIGHHLYRNTMSFHIVFNEYLYELLGSEVSLTYYEPPDALRQAMYNHDNGIMALCYGG